MVISTLVIASRAKQSSANTLFRRNKAVFLLPNALIKTLLKGALQNKVKRSTFLRNGLFALDCFALLAMTRLVMVEKGTTT